MGLGFMCLGFCRCHQAQIGPAGQGRGKDAKPHERILISPNRKIRAGVLVLSSSRGCQHTGVKAAEAVPWCPQHRT